jgi:hypothetical protein
MPLGAVLYEAGGIKHLTPTARKLHKDGGHRFAQGHITLLDRESLEERTCECYLAIKKEYGRLLPNVPAT